MAYDNLIKLNKVLYLAQGNPWDQYSLEDEWIESSPAKDLGWWWKRGWTRPSNVHLHPWRPIVSRDTSKAAWAEGLGKGFCLSTLTLWDPIWSAASRSGGLSTGRSQTCYRRCRGRLWRWLDRWKTSPMKKSWENSACSAWKRDLSWLTV